MTTYFDVMLTLTAFLPLFATAWAVSWRADKAFEARRKALLD